MSDVYGIAGTMTGIASGLYEGLRNAFQIYDFLNQRQHEQGKALADRALQIGQQEATAQNLQGSKDALSKLLYANQLQGLDFAGPKLAPEPTMPTLDPNDPKAMAQQQQYQQTRQDWENEQIDTLARYFNMKPSTETLDMGGATRVTQRSPSGRTLSSLLLPDVISPEKEAEWKIHAAERAEDRQWKVEDATRDHGFRMDELNAREERADRRADADRSSRERIASSRGSRSGADTWTAGMQKYVAEAVKQAKDGLPPGVPMDDATLQRVMHSAASEYVQLYGPRPVESLPGNRQGPVSAAAAPLLTNAATAAGVPVEVLHRVSGRESGGNPRSPDSPRGAVGVMQVMPATFRGIAARHPELRLTNVRDPQQNATAGAVYMKEMFQMAKAHGVTDDVTAWAMASAAYMHPAGVLAGLRRGYKTWPQMKRYLDSIRSNDGLTATSAYAEQIWPEVRDARPAAVQQGRPPAARPTPAPPPLPSGLAEALRQQGRTLRQAARTRRQAMNGD